MAKKSNQKATPVRGKGRTHHSKPAKKPVTIELDAKDVKTTGTSKPETQRRSVPASKSTNDASKAKSASPATKTEAALKSTAVNTPGAKETVGLDNAKSAASESTKSAAAQMRAPAKTTPSGKASSSLGSTLLAACVGGIVALGLAGLLQYAGILSTPGASNGDTQATAQLEGRIAGLEEKIQSQSEAGVTNEDVTKLIDDKLAGAPSPDTERVTQLESDLTQLRDQLSSLPAGTSVDSAIATQVAELVEEVANLKNGAQSQTDTPSAEVGVSSGQIEELTQSISKIETELSAQVEAISTKLEKTDAGRAETLAALAETNTKLDETLAKTGETNAEITALRDRVENGADKRAATAIAAAALKNDIDSGAPFNAALSNLKAFSPGMTELESLDSFAEKGVPTIAQLSAEFGGDVSDAILAATEPVEDNSLAARLAAGAKSLVEVKPIGVVEGETPQARISQIAEALKTGDLSKASEIWNVLPEAGREASIDWHARLQARLTANTVVRGTIENVLNSSRGG